MFFFDFLPYKVLILEAGKKPVPGLLVVRFFLENFCPFIISEFDTTSERQTYELYFPLLSRR